MNNSIFKSLGNTELIEIKKLTSHLPSHIKVYAKAEYQNPSGSVKDRAAFSIIQDALNAQKLSPNKILLDATSGNTGMAYAYLGQKLGFKVQLVVQQSMSQIRQNILKNYGAELIYSDPNLGFDGAIALTQKLITEHPDQYYFPDQFNNPKNWEGHFKSTIGLYHGAGYCIFEQDTVRPLWKLFIRFKIAFVVSVHDNFFAARNPIADVAADAAGRFLFHDAQGAGEFGLSHKFVLRLAVLLVHHRAAQVEIDHGRSGSAGGGRNHAIRADAHAAAA